MGRQMLSWIRRGDMKQRNSRSDGLHSSPQESWTEEPDNCVHLITLSLMHLVNF